MSKLARLLAESIAREPGFKEEFRSALEREARLEAHRVLPAVKAAAASEGPAIRVSILPDYSVRVFRKTDAGWEEVHSSELVVNFL